MPYSIITHTHGKRKCWSVINSKTGKVHSKCSTKKNAYAQLRLLESKHEK